MHPFLKALAARLTTLPTPLRQQVVVLPTRRAAYHLKRTFAEEMNHEGWLPRFATLNEFLAEVAGVENADRIDLKFACYEAYAGVMGADAQDLSAFFSWADSLIDDFNEIEAQGILPKTIFRELTEYSDLEHFSFLGHPLSEKQERYRKFWRALKDIHGRFNALLLERHLSYPGLTARLAGEKWEAYAATHPEVTVAIAGFNALSKSEVAFAKKVTATGRGFVLFDADPAFLDDLENPAGTFIRRNLRQEVGTVAPIAAPMKDRPVHITYSEATHKLAQADVVAAIIASLPAESLQDTALVLADESMLLPLLHRLPDSVTEANVTMGVPVNQGSFADWIEKVFALQGRLIGDAGAYLAPSQRVQALVKHPFAYVLSSAAGDIPLPDMRALYCPLAAYRQNLTGSAFGWLVPVLDDWRSGAKTALEALTIFAEKAEKKLEVNSHSDLETRLTAKGIETLKRLLRKLKSHAGVVELDLNALLALIKSALASQRIDLLGEPAHGLQVMGLLETRALGYGRVILCDVNEDVLPGNVHVDSFIPFDIRNYHKMPGKKEKEAVYAYHFYRLLQSCSHMHLVYHTDMSGPWSAERSRFVGQIAHHLAGQLPEMSFGALPIAKAQPAMGSSTPLIEKTAEVRSQIEEYITGRVSASGINRYFESPLEWYYGNVLKLSEPQEEGEINDADYGNLVHEALETLYKAFAKGHRFTTEDVKTMQARCEEVVKNRFEAYPRIAQYTQGINRLHYEGALAMVRDYLRTELTAIARGDEVVMVATEMKLARSLTFTHEGRELTAAFTGSADLVTQRNGILRVSDFKTGVVKSDQLNIKSLDMAAFAKKPKALQLMLYGWLVLPSYPGTDIEGQIISLPRPSDRNLLVKFRINEADHAAQFEATLIDIFHDMLSQDEALRADAEFKYSVYEPA